MPAPRLTFFCELESNDLHTLFADGSVIKDLQSLNAAVSLGLLDLKPERAEIIRRLNQAGVPVTAWLLLEKEQGYYSCLENAPQTRVCFDDFNQWRAAEGLVFSAVGLDVEPNIQDIESFFANPRRVIQGMMRRVITFRKLPQAEAAYRALVNKIHADGFPVESYQFPIIADERKAGSYLLRRLTGIVNVPVDREVWMLYTRFSLTPGVGYLWNYASEAQAIAVGSTGGGLEVGEGHPRPLDWDELSRDLRLAWYWTDNLYIFSLEGCVRQGFLKRLESFAWDVPIFFPEYQAEAFTRLRGALQSGLWLSRRLGPIAASAAATWWLASRIRAWIKQR
jgi:hypothetical protein